MILFIYGEDTFRSRQYLKKTIEQFKKQRDPQGYNVVILGSKKEDTVKVLGEITAAPFLAEKRMVVLENILSCTDKGLLTELLDRVKSQNIPQSNIVVFWQGDVFGKSGAVKELAAVLAKEKYAQEFKIMDIGELSAWVGKEIVARGGKIGSQALGYLSKNAGSDMWLLRSILDQLVAYKKGVEISLVDARLFLMEKEDDNIFNMVDAVVSGNKKLAFKLMDDQRKLGEDDTYLFSMITRQFRILVQLRDLFERKDNMTSDVLAKELGLHPFVVKKSLPVARKYPLSKLKNIYEQLLQIDIKTKTGQGDQSVLIDLFVGKS